MNLYRLGYALGTLARPIVNLVFPPRPRSLAAHFADDPRDWPTPPADYDPVAVWRELDDRNLADRLNEWSK